MNMIAESIYVIMLLRCCSVIFSAICFLILMLIYWNQL